MLKRILRSIRQKPKPVRDNAAMLIAGAFTCMVFLLWAYHAPTKFSAAEKQGVQTESPSGFTDLFGRIGSQLGAITEAVKSEEGDEAVSPISSETGDGETEQPAVNSAATTTPMKDLESTSSVAVPTPTPQAEQLSSQARVVKIVTVNSSSTTSTSTTKSR